MKLKIPFYRQKTYFTCGPAALKIVLSFLGDIRSERALAKEMNTNRATGTTHEQMIAAARNEGFFCYVNENSSVHEIKHFIHLGLPVIINETFRNDGHYVVVTGFIKDRLVIDNPFPFPKKIPRTIPEKDFVSVWHDNVLTKSNKWIMVLSRESFDIGRQYLPAQNKTF